MEGRDLSSSTTPSSTANRDASSATDADDGVLTVTVALAKDAALHFQSGKFAECVEVLNQLSQKKQQDPKVIVPFPFSIDTDSFDAVSLLSLSFYSLREMLDFSRVWLFLFSFPASSFDDCADSNCDTSGDWFVGLVLYF